MPITPATIIAAFFFGAISAFLAGKRGRSPYKWFFIGFLFGIFGLMAILLAPQKKGAQSIRALEIKAEPPVPAILGPSDKFWYYLDPLHQQQGPMSYTALTNAFRQGKISLATFVWNEEMTEWKALQEFVKG